ncbi:DUF7684 family protein [Comamonas sp. 4034]|uniref:DUF7684 family protein n=1 Tax=Comamonas sp. 4034 TaxID=3156455 RepID=UPI003D1F2811
MTDNSIKKIIFSSDFEEGLVQFSSSQFAVLLDVRFLENNKNFLEKVVKLYECGARYFVCYGDQSEVFHDAIDDIFICDDDLNDIVTTFHVDESIEEVANFFMKIVMMNFNYGLVISSDEASWRIELY